MRVSFVLVIATCLFCGQVSAQIAATESIRSLFEFDASNDASSWNLVNDGVMGGRSSSQASVTGSGVMRFQGFLSLANNGGFASVRSSPRLLGLASGDEIVLRVKGDGRKYTFNLYTPERRTAFSYQLDFQTIKDQWQEVRLPVNQFVAHSFGRPISNLRLNASRVQSLGILLGDKRQGNFAIEVDWIRVD
ncbi:MAG: CIA30 family protein [Planctomycetota bacterium]